MEEHTLQVRHKQDWGLGFILILPHATVLAGADVGIDVAKSALDFVISDLVLRAVPDEWGTLLTCGLRFVQMHRTRDSDTKPDSICAWTNGQIESSITSWQAIEPNPSCSGQAHSNRPGTGYDIIARTLDVLSQYSVSHL